MLLEGSGSRNQGQQFTWIGFNVTREKEQKKEQQGRVDELHCDHSRNLENNSFLFILQSI
jgi:hypothetical protein